MKTGIHPEYKKTVIVCSTCKKEYILGSTVDGIRVELCSNCHPFYTGKETLVDTDNLVDKFNKKRTAAETNTKVIKNKKEKREARKLKAASQNKPLTLKDMLSQVK